MKHKGLIITAVIVVLIIIIGSAVAGTYNGMVSAQTEVENAFANIDVQLQRRADLIPNIVNTVKGYAAHESETINAVVEARAKLAGATNINDKVEANNEMTSALSRLLVVVENYPDLKANTQFTALTDELAGTENRIGVSRKDYNDIVKEYNKSIKQFPKNIIAGIFGFEAINYFEAAEGSLSAPSVEF